MRVRKVHHNDGTRILCNPGVRRGLWSCDITSTRGTKKVTCKTCLRLLRK
jgi:hypothetical protein